MPMDSTRGKISPSGIKLKPLRLVLVSRQLVSPSATSPVFHRKAYQNLYFLSFLFFLKYESHRMPRAVAKAAIMLKEARTMVEVLMDLAAENFNSLRNCCWVLVVLLLSVWKLVVVGVMKLPCMAQLVSSRDCIHPAPANGDIGLIRRAATRLAMATKP